MFAANFGIEVVFGTAVFEVQTESARYFFHIHVVGRIDILGGSHVVIICHLVLNVQRLAQTFLVNYQLVGNVFLQIVHVNRYCVAVIDCYRNARYRFCNVAVLAHHRRGACREGGGKRGAVQPCASVWRKIFRSAVAERCKNRKPCRVESVALEIGGFDRRTGNGNVGYLFDGYTSGGIDGSVILVACRYCNGTLRFCRNHAAVGNGSNRVVGRSPTCVGSCVGGCGYRRQCVGVAYGNSYR